jgi:hypothetical protein
MKYTIVSALLLLSIIAVSCNNDKDEPAVPGSNTENKKDTLPPAPPAIPPVDIKNPKVGDTTTVSLLFTDYSEGDYAHLIFKSTDSSFEWDFGHPDENKLNDIPIVLPDDKTAWGYRINKAFVYKPFTVTIQYKDLDGNDLDGKPMKYRDWRIIRLRQN